jgi:hypothetical protein
MYNMPRCPNGSKRSPPKVGKCNKSAAKRSVKRKPKHNRSVKKSSKVTSIEKLSTVAPTNNVPHKQTMKWIDHLKMCSSQFNIKYGAAMTDKRCKNLWELGHE